MYPKVEVTIEYFGLVTTVWYSEKSFFTTYNCFGHIYTGKGLSFDIFLN